VRPHQKSAIYFVGDPNLGHHLLNQIQHGPVYDEVGDIRTYGWYGLLKYNGISYIVCYAEDTFQYKKYPTYKSALKAWDHVCAKYEKWFISQ